MLLKQIRITQGLFSIDDFAWHDIPDSINHILDVTKQPKLSYVGFSQGTAQAFAALSIHPGLNERINVFIALAPAMNPAGLASHMVDGLMKASYVILPRTVNSLSLTSH
jgi:lysosomal acid lipase/cholesteryl ester hydrolase